jgi:hypothetical protein
VFLKKRCNVCTSLHNWNRKQYKNEDCLYLTNLMYIWLFNLRMMYAFTEYMNAKLNSKRPTTWIITATCMRRASVKYPGAKSHRRLPAAGKRCPYQPPATAALPRAVSGVICYMRWAAGAIAGGVGILATMYSVASWEPLFRDCRSAESQVARSVLSLQTRSTEYTWARQLSWAGLHLIHHLTGLYYTR